jgi:hypothetical protein
MRLHADVTASIAQLLKTRWNDGQCCGRCRLVDGGRSSCGQMAQSGAAFDDWREFPRTDDRGAQNRTGMVRGNG